jgi:hypothetical protein
MAISPDKSDILSILIEAGVKLNLRDEVGFDLL